MPENPQNAKPPKKTSSPRAGGRQARHRKRAATPRGGRGSSLGVRIRPLSDADVERVHAAALDLLEQIGMQSAAMPERVKNAALAHGCLLTGECRLRFPRALVEDMIARAAKRFDVYARDPAWDFEAANDRINFCTGGAAVSMLDLATRTYRPSTLADLYDLARLCDRLENLQWFARPVVATDVDGLFELDANTIYACAAGTQKHIATSITLGAHIPRLVPMLDALAGGDGNGAAFARRPFCTAHATTVVSPLTFAHDSLEVAANAVDIGMPVHCQTGPQAGATAPVALAGTLAQVCAEGLASLAVINMLKPGHPVVLGNWAFVSDLRTGAFSGGGGEQALLGAASGQMSRFYGIPGGMGAGMSDSKLPDNQAGFEKGLTMALAALSGGGLVFESAGMLASLLGCSAESMVIDNEMLTSIRRIGRGIEVTDETLSVEVIRDAVAGSGHFLGAKQTMELMETEFVYPEHADRSTPEQWADAGAPDIRERACETAREILARHRPHYIAAGADALIRARYPIRLPPRGRAEANS